jgi:hypothetical protein
MKETSAPTLLNRGDKARGEYHGVAFTGTVVGRQERFNEAYYEIAFDMPLVIRGSERTGICMYGVNKEDFVVRA